MRAETDEQLIASLSSGRVEALEELYRRYARKLYIFCSRTMSAATAEDVVHDVFLRLLERSAQFSAERASLKTWLYRIARNRCIDLARRDAALRFASLQEGGRVGSGDEERPLPAGVSSGEGSGEAVATRSLVVEAVRACVDRLMSRDERQALVLYYLGGKVYREVGVILGRSTSMAQKLVRMARERVRRCLSRRGVGA